MDRKHEKVRQGLLRRRSLPWDRMKIGLLFTLILSASYSSRVNGRFTSPREALSELWSGQWWLFVLLGLEILRQAHYWSSERFSGYHQFWTKSYGDLAVLRLFNLVDNAVHYLILNPTFSGLRLGIIP